MFFFTNAILFSGSHKFDSAKPGHHVQLRLGVGHGDVGAAVSVHPQKEGQTGGGGHQNFARTRVKNIQQHKDSN